MRAHLNASVYRSTVAAEGYAKLNPDLGFHETKQGVRFTISEGARREVLGRLLRLNHERYAEEVAQGRHEKGAKKRGGRKAGGKADEGQLALE